MAAIWPEVFMVALTVAECSRPMSTHVLHEEAVGAHDVADVGDVPLGLEVADRDLVAAVALVGLLIRTLLRGS